jgi:hypothetical protein
LAYFEFFLVVVDGKLLVQMTMSLVVGMLLVDDYLLMKQEDFDLHTF